MMDQKMKIPTIMNNKIIINNMPRRKKNIKKEECIICLDVIKSNETKISASHDLVKHNGYYHVDCIKFYLESLSLPRCPLCRDICEFDIKDYLHKGLTQYKINNDVYSNTTRLNISLSQITIIGPNNEYMLTLYTTNIILALNRLFVFPESTTLCVYVYSIYLLGVYLMYMFQSDSRRRVIDNICLINFIIRLYLSAEFVFYTSQIIKEIIYENILLKEKIDELY